jgi:hypothetical protein
MRLSSTVLNAISKGSAEKPNSTNATAPEQPDLVAVGGDFGHFQAVPASHGDTKSNGVKLHPGGDSKSNNDRTSSASTGALSYHNSQSYLLAQKQLAIQQGLDILTKARFELKQAKNGAEFWGNVAVWANVILVPANCIVNALELKKANGLLRMAYQQTVKFLYDRYARSGTRIEGNGKKILSEIKRATTEELKRRGLTDWIPGVNILMGLAEDTIALYQTMDMVDKGRGEINNLQNNLDRNIFRMQNELVKLGILQAEEYRKYEIRERTA